MVLNADPRVFHLTLSSIHNGLIWRWARRRLLNSSWWVTIIFADGIISGHYQPRLHINCSEKHLCERHIVKPHSPVILWIWSAENSGTTQLIVIWAPCLTVVVSMPDFSPSSSSDCISWIWAWHCWQCCCPRWPWSSCCRWGCGIRAITSHG